MTHEEVQAVFGERSHSFDIVKKIGEGGFGSVWLARDRSLGARLVAVKVMDRRRVSSLDFAVWEREYEGVRLYAGKIRQHPNLVQIYSCAKTDTCLHYAMEIADNANGPNSEEYVADTLAVRLMRHVKNGTHPTPAQIQNLILGLLSAVGTLHAAGLCHRDIKPENIIYVAGLPKLSDVGSVREISDARCAGVTPAYLPPEALEGRYDPIAHDFYAIGKVIYCCLSLRSGEDYPIIDDLAILSQATFRRLNAFVLECACAEDFTKRYHAADDFRAGFQKCFKKSLWRRWGFLNGLIALGVASIGAGVSFWGIQSLKHSPPPPAIKDISTQQLLSGGGAQALFLNAKLLKKGDRYILKMKDYGTFSACIWISEPMSLKDLPRSLVLSNLPATACLRIAQVHGAAIPETVRNVYEDWDMWTLVPRCQVDFLKGRGIAVFNQRNPFWSESTLMGNILPENGRTATFTLERGDGQKLEILVNSHQITHNFIPAGENDTIRLLFALSAAEAAEIGIETF